MYSTSTDSWGSSSWGSTTSTSNSFEYFSTDYDKTYDKIYYANDLDDWVHVAWRRGEELRRKRRAVRAIRPLLDFLTAPRALIMLRHTWGHCFNVRGEFRGRIEADPKNFYTYGIASNVRTGEIEMWASSPTTMQCYRIDAEDMRWSVQGERSHSLIKSWILRLEASLS